MNRVEAPIYNRPGLSGGKFLGQLDSFVQDDPRRSVLAAHFMNRQAQNGAIDGREPFEPPVVGMLDDDGVQRSDILRRAFKKFVRESASFVRSLRTAPEFHFQLAKILLAHVPLEQHLDRKSTRLNSSH